MSTHRSQRNLLERDETKALPAMEDEPILNATSNNFARLDLKSIRQSVYDLIDQYPGQVLFLEYLTRHNRVENMTASSYKNLYQFSFAFLYPRPGHRYIRRPQNIAHTCEHTFAPRPDH